MENELQAAKRPSNFDSRLERAGGRATTRRREQASIKVKAARTQGKKARSAWLMNLISTSILVVVLSTTAYILANRRRSTPSMATATSLLKSLIVPPASGQPATATLIFAHGLGDSGAGWLDVAQMLSRRPALRHVRFVLPNAPVQPVTLNMGMSMPSWFDIHSLDDFEEKEDEAGLKKSAAAIANLVRAEVDGTAEGLGGKGVPADRVVVGGFSQVSCGAAAKVAAAARQAVQDARGRSGDGSMGRGSGGILGVGVDVIHRPRLDELLARAKGRARGGGDHLAHFSRRILCPAEQEELSQLSSPPQPWLAVRWAAKEAAYKALYPGLRLRWSDLRVAKDDGVKPALRFSSESAVPLEERPQLHLSVSHDGDYVIAFVVATSSEGKGCEGGESRVEAG